MLLTKKQRKKQRKKQTNKSPENNNPFPYQGGVMNEWIRKFSAYWTVLRGAEMLKSEMLNDQGMDGVGDSATC